MSIRTAIAGTLVKRHGLIEEWDTTKQIDVVDDIVRAINNDAARDSELEKLIERATNPYGIDGNLHSPIPVTPREVLKRLRELKVIVTHDKLSV